MGDLPMKTLEKPKFQDLPRGEYGGAPILRQLWDRFDFSLLLTQSVSQSAVTHPLGCFVCVK